MVLGYIDYHISWVLMVLGYIDYHICWVSMVLGCHVYPETRQESCDVGLSEKIDEAQVEVEK